MKKIYYSLILVSALLVSINSYATTHTISVANFSFTPSTLNVTVGDTILWNWVGGNHNTASISVPAGALPWGSPTPEPLNSSSQTFTYVITTAGTYQYQCTFHPSSMQGTIVATGGSGVFAPDLNSSFSLMSISPSTYALSFSISKPANISIKLFDLTGKLSRVFANQPMPAGFFSEQYSLADLQKGIYLLEINADYQRIVRRVILD